MHSDPVVIWSELPSLTQTVDAVESASMWDQPRRIQEPPLQAGSVSSSGGYYESPLVLDTDRFASPGNPDMRMDAVLCRRPVNPSNTPDEMVFLHYPAASADITLTCVVAGEPFQLDFGSDESDHYILQHRRWSLCGFGNSLEEAVQDLLTMAQAIAPDYLQLDLSELTDNARDLSAFLQRVL